MENRPLLEKPTGSLNSTSQASVHTISSEPKSKSGPSGCAVCCFFFSLIAAFLLALLGSYIISESPHIILDKFPGSKEDKDTRTHKALGAFGASVLYIVTGLISLYYWRRDV